jgi:hypothetical protein
MKEKEGEKKEESASKLENAYGSYGRIELQCAAQYY